MGDSLRAGESPAAQGHRFDMEARRLRWLPRVEVLGHRVPLAAGLRARLLGLALLPRRRAGAGLLIPRCSSVHTFGMRFAIDVFFLDAEGQLLSSRRSVPGCRIVACAGASAVLELPCHACTGSPSRVQSRQPLKGEMN
jgi:uncharacterized membrane protein (UPF0127 family)